MASQQIPSVVQAFRFPSLNSIELLKLIDEFNQEDFGLILNGNIQIQKLSGDKFAIFMPAHNSSSNLSENETLKLHEQLKKAYQIVTGEQKIGRGSETTVAIKIGEYLKLIEGAMICALDTKIGEGASKKNVSDTEPNLERIDSESEEVFVIVNGSVNELTETVQSVLRHGRDVKIHPLGAEENELLSVFLSFSDSSVDYGTVSGWIAGGEYQENLQFLIPTTAAGYKVWLPVQSTLPDGQSLAILGSILKKAKHIETEQYDFTDMIFLPQEEKQASIYYCRLDDTKIEYEEIAENLEPAEPYNLRIIKTLDADATKNALKNAINDNRDKVGYRVSIKPVPDHITAELDTEQILDKIQELEETVAQITALKSPQLKLMRFSDEQLQALIDALRSLPPDELKKGDLLYASGHSAGRSEPVHYILYNPMANVIKFSEIIWRDKTEDHSMSYWLEPFVAEAQITRPSKTKVFVPQGHFLVPSLAHFGGDIDGTLKILLGELFSKLGTNLTEEAAEPIFVFSKFEDEYFNLEVEIVDRRSFQPVHENLHWLNDYLMVRGSQIVNQEDLREVALDLYQGRSATNIRDQIEEYSTDLETDWQEATNKIETEYIEIFNALIKDIDATSNRIKDVYEFVVQMSYRLDVLEQLMIEVSDALSLKKQAIESMSTKDAELLTARRTFLDRLRAETQMGEANLIKAENKISELKARLNQIIDWDKNEK